MCVCVNVTFHSVPSPFREGLQSTGCIVSACCCCCCPVVGLWMQLLQSCFPALLAGKSSHDAVLKKLPGNPFSTECADTLGWSVFVLAPLLVVVLTLKRCFRALNLPSWAEAARPARQAEITWNRQLRSSTLHVAGLISDYCVYSDKNETKQSDLFQRHSSPKNSCMSSVALKEITTLEKITLCWIMGIENPNLFVALPVLGTKTISQPLLLWFSPVFVKWLVSSPA